MQEPLTDLLAGAVEAPEPDDEAYRQVRERVQSLISAARALSDTCADLADALRPVPGHLPDDPLVAAFGRLRAERTAALLDEAASAARGTLGLLHSAYGALDRRPRPVPPAPRSGATTWPDAFVEVPARGFTLDEEAGTAVGLRSPWAPARAAHPNDATDPHGIPAVADLPAAMLVPAADPAPDADEGLRAEVTALAGADDSTAEGLRAWATPPSPGPAPSVAASGAGPGGKTEGGPAATDDASPAAGGPEAGAIPTVGGSASPTVGGAAEPVAGLATGGIPEPAAEDSAGPIAGGTTSLAAAGTVGTDAGPATADAEPGATDAEPGATDAEPAGADAESAGATAWPDAAGPTSGPEAADAGSAAGDAAPTTSEAGPAARNAGPAADEPVEPIAEAAQDEAAGPAHAEPIADATDDAASVGPAEVGAVADGPESVPGGAGGPEELDGLRATAIAEEDDATEDTEHGPEDVDGEGLRGWATTGLGIPAANWSRSQTQRQSQARSHRAPDDDIPEHAIPEHAAPEGASPEHASPEHASPEIASPEIASPEIASPEIAAHENDGPEHAAPERATPEPVSSENAGPGLAASGDDAASGRAAETGEGLDQGADGTSVEDTDADDPALLTSAALAGWMVVDPDDADDPGRPIQLADTGSRVYAATAEPARVTLPIEPDPRTPVGEVLSDRPPTADTPFGLGPAQPAPDGDPVGLATDPLGPTTLPPADPDALDGDRFAGHPTGPGPQHEHRFAGHPTGPGPLDRDRFAGQPATADRFAASTPTGPGPLDGDRFAGIPASAGPLDGDRFGVDVDRFGTDDTAGWHGDTVSAEPRSLSLVPPPPDGPETATPTWGDDRMPSPADPWAAEPAPSPWPDDPMAGADLSGAAMFARVERPVWTAEPVPGSSVAGDGVAVFPISAANTATPVAPSVPLDEPAAAVISRQVEAARRHLQAALVVANGPSAPSGLGALLTAIEQVLTAVTDLARETRGVLDQGLADRTYPGEARFLCSPPWDGTQLVGRDAYGDDVASPAGLAKLLRALGYEAHSVTASSGAAGVQIRDERYAMQVALVEPAGGGRQRWSGALEWVDGTGASRTWAETIGPVELEDEELARRVDELLRRSVGA